MRKEQRGGLGHENFWAENSEVERDPSSLHQLCVHMEAGPFHAGSTGTGSPFAQVNLYAAFPFYSLTKNLSFLCCSVVSEQCCDSLQVNTEGTQCHTCTRIPSPPNSPPIQATT